MTDYDRTDIPAGYDRARDHGPQVTAFWMHTLSQLLAGRTSRRILDLGCGTGRFSEALAGQFDANVVGLDPSSKMLAVASAKRRDRRVHYALGRAEAIPVRHHAADLVFMSMSLHHFTDPRLAARECRRVLSADGAVIIRTGTRDQIPQYPYVPFFPASRPLLEETLPTRAEIVDLYAEVDCCEVTQTVIPQTIAPDWLSYADKLAAGGDSILARLSRHDFEAGLAAVRQFGTSNTPQPVVEPIDLFVLSVRGPSAAA